MRDIIVEKVLRYLLREKIGDIGIRIMNELTIERYIWQMKQICICKEYRKKVKEGYVGEVQMRIGKKTYMNYNYRDINNRNIFLFLTRRRYHRYFDNDIYHKDGTKYKQTVGTLPKNY